MKIVVFNEKHDRRYFVITAEAGSEQEATQLQAIALHVVKERNEDGWYCVEDLTQDMTKKEYHYYERAVQGDAKAALTFLNARKEWEYEGFDIIEPDVL